MDWTATPNNPHVASAFDAYKAFVMQVATHYAGSRLMEQVDLGDVGHDTDLALSSDFSTGFTTIRTIADLTGSIGSGEFGQLCLRLATVQLCTAFEVVLDSICKIYSVGVGKAPITVSYKPLSPKPLLLGNETIRQIRWIHDHLRIASVMNNDDVLVKLSAIIELRNCIVHSAGRVTDDKAAFRLRAYAIRHNAGDLIHLHDNLFDDFLHYMAIHVVAFVRALP